MACAPGEGATECAIALYDTTNGAYVRDMTTGTSNSNPTRSPDETALCFDCAGTQYVRPLDGEEVALGPGIQPTGGGTGH